MAKGEFCWLLGNDDIVLKNTFEKLNTLLKSKKNIDFFYLNSYQLNLNDIEKLEHPLKPNEINFENKKKFLNSFILKK